MQMVENLKEQKMKVEAENIGEKDDKENKKDTHNLGKTSLLVVIDFLLLSTFTKKSPILANRSLKMYLTYP